MRPTFAALIAVSAVTGCGDSQSTQPSQPIVVRSEAQDRLHQLDDMDRAIALKRAIYDSGSTCRRVTESGYVQEVQNLSMWTASCDDGRDWSIFVGPDGSAQVRPCQDLAQFKLPACVIRQTPRPAGYSHLRVILTSPAAVPSLTVVQLPTLVSSRQLPSALVVRLLLGTRLPSLIS